jgi:oligoribonuclease NrnB/cAMP/cGMP phosphodiesterase (DHH superfamily)
MDDRLIDDDRLSLERMSVLPGEGFFYPDSLQQRQAEREAVETLQEADIAVVADPDADGLACVALVREARGEGALVPAGPHRIADALAWVGEHGAGTDIYVCDLCPDGESDLDPLAAATERAASMAWYDHHQWDPELATQVRGAGVDLVVGESDEVCTANVALSELDADFGAAYEELVAVTRDHDLWVREDDRSDDLADYAHWAEHEEYIETIRNHGADLPETVQEMLAERRVQKERLVEKAVERGRLRDIGPWTVGVTYGRCSQNEVAEAFREQGADASVVVKPSGSASIRGTDAFERCHEVAAQVNGGGHPKAAGCKPGIYDDMLDYAHHWSTRGAVAKEAILEGFRRLADEQKA